jgi:hypothetical protein
LALFIPEIEQNLRIDFGQSENRRTVDFRTGESGATFERDTAHRIPEPSMIFRKYQLSQRLA